MLFNSIPFLIFLPIVFIIYWHLFSKNLQLQNCLLLLSSYFFYAWWDYRFLSLIIISTVVDFYCGKKIAEAKNKKHELLFLSLSLFTNLGILGTFKYYNFFVSSFYDLIQLIGYDNISYSTLNIVLPVGISFYTFQTLSYTIDIYRRQLKPSTNFISFAAFVSFFPQLVAGPIERAKNLLPQINKPRSFDYQYSIVGFRLIVWGMFKKVVVADNLAQYVDIFYSSHTSFGTIGTILGMLFFTFQIYCDFSGYSDIAIGVARLFGIKLNRNFNIPYKSKSFGEFWQRWHISLSSWFRDYVYIALGGNRVSKILNFRNLIITFGVSGLWHGASYNFIIWGLIHSMLLIIERTKFFKYFRKNANQFIQAMLVFIITNYTWVVFRTNDMQQAIEIFTTSLNIKSLYQNLNIDPNNILSESGILINDIYFMITSIIFVMFIELFDKKLSKNSIIKSNAIQYLYLQLLIFFIVLMSTIGNKVNFIYFQF